MKINVYSSKEEDLYRVAFSEENSNHQESGFSFTCNLEQLKELNQKISDVIQEVENGKVTEEVVWNPRSQRHEKITVKK